MEADAGAVSGAEVLPVVARVLVVTGAVETLATLTADEGIAAVEAD